MARATEIEFTPEVDALDDIALPRERSELFGHEEAEQELLNAYRSQRFHHAWLIGGPKGVGKATLAFRFARFALANPDRFGAQVMSARDLSVPMESHSARMVAAGSHADLLHLRRPWDEKGKRFKRDLPVDEVRRTVSFFGSTAAGGSWRICIVDAADDMNASAANALLKVLEEPPQNSCFLVLSHNPGRLLPTIRSRCRRLELRKLSDQQITRGLGAYNVQVPHDSAEVDALMAMADGSLRQAILTADGPALALSRDFFSMLRNPADIDMRTAHDFADRVAMRGADDNWACFLELVRNYISGQLRKDKTLHAGHLVRWADLWEKVGQTAALTDALNLDRKQAVLTFLFEIRDAFRQFPAQS
ncbi:DNA polymerase III subunit delta' [Rhodobacteraceae bacterium RKSG542]|uniref:DNA polymerase III subunit delta' n=1 Tax=Pseudovibrio flavus TaxID=2529854 RepID=UPI0012BC0DDD|nr:DNA polymerase III subunit delta' [Pseudovibrio flavus]MTI17453.1 DNA polymerase III subunit delta' [Pseudovibrio flavus]